MDVKKKLDELDNKITEAIESAGSLKKLEEIRVLYFGKKSEFINLLKNISSLPKVERPILGKLINDVKKRLLEKFEARKLNLEGENVADISKNFDFTIPGKPFGIGHLHPLTQVANEIIDIFKQLGFGVAEGPDIETDYYNFTALNFPIEHPARDTQDTFFLKTKETESKKPLLLRTHTSPVQIRFMKENKPPFQMIMPGSVYRCDSDVSHTPLFHQVEGLAVGDNISFASLKSVLTEFVHKMFGPDTRLRFRPSFFPFTEPSAEIDISCVICEGKGCRVCKDSGWLEILGAGMVHPNVFKSAGYDPEKNIGFAFGMGIERIAMLKYRVDDIRLFFENDIRFLKQF